MLKKPAYSAFAAVSVLAALVVLVAYVTQAANIQIVFLQPVYWVLDAEWGAVRAIFLLAAAAGGTAVLILRAREPDKLITGRAVLKMIGAILEGLILGLVVFYAHTCCDTPVVYYSGFPLSWLWGVTPDVHFLPLPVLPYLLQNVGRIRWFIDGFGLLVDILFWWNVGLMIFAVQKRIRANQTLKMEASSKSVK